MSKRASLLTHDFDDYTYDMVLVSSESALDPHRKLLLAVIVQAVDDATNPNAKAKDRESAYRILTSSGPTELKGMCHHLGIDPDYLKRVVVKMRAEGRSINRKIIYD